MNRRRWRIAILGGLLAAVAAVVFGPPGPWPSGPRPCRATFAKVQVGMTRDEVLATIGATPDELDDDDSYRFTPFDHIWPGEDALLGVCFDQSDRVRTVQVMGGPPVTFGGRVRRWLGNLGNDIWGVAAACGALGLIAYAVAVRCGVRRAGRRAPEQAADYDDRPPRP
jgi:hypothetical protein